MSRVLLAIDGSEFAERACARALALLGTEHEFIALSVIRAALTTVSSALPESLPGSLEMVEDSEGDPEASLRQSARLDSEARADIEQVLRRLHITARELVETGDAGEIICSVAQRERVDVVVIGSHDRGIAHRLLGGSVTRHIVQHAPCLVLVHGRQAS